MRAGRVIRGAAVVIVGALALGSAACSSDDKDDSAATTTTTTPAEATCDAWSATTDAFQSFDDIDLLNEGLNSVRTYVDGLESSVQDLESAASAQYKPYIEDVRTALQNLKDGVTSDTVSIDGIRTEVADVKTAWNALVAEFQTECPDVTAGTAST